MGSMKSKGIKPMAPASALMSPKKGSMAAMNAQTIMYRDRSTSLGSKFLIAKYALFDIC